VSAAPCQLASKVPAALYIPALATLTE